MEVGRLEALDASGMEAVCSLWPQERQGSSHTFLIACHHENTKSFVPGARGHLTKIWGTF
jgi:hypothetical protein